MYKVLLSTFIIKLLLWGYLLTFINQISIKDTLKLYRVGFCYLVLLYSVSHCTREMIVEVTKWSYTPSFAQVMSLLRESASDDYKETPNNAVYRVVYVCVRVFGGKKGNLYVCFPAFNVQFVKKFKISYTNILTTYDKIF